MLQKELAKRLKARYDTKMDGSGWLEVSSDGIPLCRIKYNGQFLSNADQNLSDEYRSTKTARRYGQQNRDGERNCGNCSR